MRREGYVPVLGSNGQVGFHSVANTRGPCVIVGRKGSFGKVNYSDTPAFAIDTTYFVDKRYSENNLRWLFYLLGSIGLDDVTRDSAIPGLNRVDAYERLIPLPPLPEQRAIAKYLDYMDRRIQRYIEAKERLIELLEEQKRVVINQAVTRGLDPDVRLKSSGVEWLGDVPAHWEVRRLKFLATKFGSGVTPRGGAAVYKEAGIPFLRSQNVHFDGLRLDGVARIDRELHDELPASHVMGGDVLLNITGASIGRTCAVPEGFGDGNVNQHVCIIRTRRDVMSSAFLTAFLSTSFIQRRIRNELGGASREGLTLQSIRDFEVLVPPLDEQHRITDYVRECSSEALGRGNRTLNQIELIKEYRTRLIADVVTGKLDVRDVLTENLDIETNVSESKTTEVTG